MEISPRFEWSPVITLKKLPYAYPMKRAVLSGKSYSLPAIYRWQLSCPQEKPRFLVGETEDLYRRIGEYLAHKNEHHRNIRKEFDRCCASGGQVGIEILQFEIFVINGVIFSVDKVYDPFIRGVLENLCCAYLRKQSFELLNATLEKKLVRELMKLQKNSPEAFSTLMDQMRAKKSGKTRED